MTSRSILNRRCRPRRPTCFPRCVVCTRSRVSRRSIHVWYTTVNGRLSRIVFLSLRVYSAACGEPEGAHRVRRVASERDQGAPVAGVDRLGGHEQARSAGAVHARCASCVQRRVCEFVCLSKRSNSVILSVAFENDILVCLRVCIHYPISSRAFLTVVTRSRSAQIAATSSRSRTK